jgi:hypothetical protein
VIDAAKLLLHNFYTMQAFVLKEKNRFLLERFFAINIFCEGRPRHGAAISGSRLPVPVHGMKKHAHFLWISL